MNLGELRAMLIRRLNRDDCDNDLADGFIEEGVSRIQREVRAPFMERIFYVDPTTTAVDSIILPADYLEGIEVLVGGLPLEKVAFRVLARIQETAPRAYARYSNQIFLRGAAPPGQRVELLYYASFEGLADDAATNSLLSIAPDLLLYAALSPAGDHFQIERTSEWEARYLSLRDAILNQVREDEMNGGPLSMEPAYRDPGN